MVKRRDPWPTHTALTQACEAPHARPQAPQLALLVWRLTHTPLQLVAPAGHDDPHTPLVQVAEPPVGALHTRPQAPQLPTAPRRSVSQPLAALPSQLPKLVAQAPSAQVPEAQVAVPLAKLHARPQAPQWFTSVPVARQVPAQWVWPAGQVCPQTPAVQLAPPPAAAGQAVRQVPQLAVSAATLTSQPLAALPSQSAKPAAQA